MGWTNPTTRQTGYLITASDWNTDLVNNLDFLKGRAGVVELEAGIVSDTHNTDDLGTAAKEWKNGYFVNLYASRFRVGPNIREVRVLWEDDTFSNYQVTGSSAGAGSAGPVLAGTGQMLLQAGRGASGHSRVDQTSNIANSLANSWAAGRKPYYRLEFGINAHNTEIRVFLGFRASLGASIPTTENHCGIEWDGSNWRRTNADGTTQSAVNLATVPTLVDRNVVEIYLNAATDLEIWINGSREAVVTSNLPTGSMEWTILLESVGGGTGTDYLTVGQLILQEELS